MQKIKLVLASMSLMALTACSFGPVTTSSVSTYSLHAMSNFGQTTDAHNGGVLLVTASSASTSYNSTNMYYQQQPYQLQSFAKNAWLNTPSDMIANNVTESLNQLHYFKAVLSGVNPGVKIAYTLNTRLLGLYQDFTVKPSTMVMSIEVTLITNSNGKVLSSQIYTYKIPCTEDTPYGGVLAASKALTQFLNEVDQQVLTATAH